MVPARAARCRHPGNLTTPSHNVLTFFVHIYYPDFNAYVTQTTKLWVLSARLLQ